MRFHERGVALLVMLIVLMGSMAAVAIGMLGSRTLSQKRAPETLASMAQAKEALIAWAVSHPLSAASTSDRPGGFPCPDLNTPGTSSEGTESTCTAVGAIGRLPWKTLGIPRLTDEYGNTLWYALSGRFRNRPNVAINSDTVAQYQVYDPSGTTLLTPAGKEAVAVVFAPGAALANQVRDTTVAACPALGAPRPRNECPNNYLDAASGRNNASRTGPFIAGSQSATFNDRLLFISKSDFMRQVENRVAREVLYCLNTYARDANNMGHLPWLAPLSLTLPPSYKSTSTTRFGRLADEGAGPMADTKTDSNSVMKDTLPQDCKTTLNAANQWWVNWKEMVFVGIANVNRPTNPMTALFPWTAAQCSAAGACLTLCTPNVPCAASPPADKRVVVIVAGEKLAGQNRATNGDKGNIANYLEGTNASLGDDQFEMRNFSATFNDVVVWE